MSEVEAAGIELEGNFDATDSAVCDCENCQQCRAANALHFECFKSYFLATLGADHGNDVLTGSGPDGQRSSQRAMAIAACRIYFCTSLSSGGNSLLRTCFVFASIFHQRHDVSLEQNSDRVRLLNGQ